MRSRLQRRTAKPPSPEGNGFCSLCSTHRKGGLLTILANRSQSPAFCHYPARLSSPVWFLDSSSHSEAPENGKKPPPTWKAVSLLYLCPNSAPVAVAEVELTKTRVHICQRFL